MTDLDGIPGPGLEEYAEKAPKPPCPSCDRDLSYPGQPGHRCYTYAERAANIARRPFRHLCPEADRIDGMTDDAFWEHVYGADPADSEPPEQEVTVGDPCRVCGSPGACGYDSEGLPLIHADGWNEDED